MRRAMSSRPKPKGYMPKDKVDLGIPQKPLEVFVRGCALD